MKKEIPHTKVRLRFAPSPTGPLHIGGARTALFNFIIAQQYKGDFILRIEDTDKERSELKWVPEIIDELQWLGIRWSEGPDIGGPYGPYKQSQRTDIYKKYLEQLLTEEKAYYCNCSTEELEAKRQDQQARGLAPRYDGKCRNKKNTTGVIRLKVAEKKIYVNDLIRGKVEFDMALLGDMVIAKNLETPLYHFVVIIDDALMEISHVIRGEEHLSNTPKQILLQEALGFVTPHYAHLPLMLNADKSKMSKRAGDVALADYHKKGYLPEAIINFIALLGWNPGTEREFFSLDALMKEFSLERVQKAGAVFNTDRLDFMNGMYIREKSAEALVKLCMPYLPVGSEDLPKVYLEKIIEAHKPRMKKLSDIAELADYFFVEQVSYEKSLLAWQGMGEDAVREALLLCDKSLRLVPSEDWHAKSLEEAILAHIEDFNTAHAYPAQNKGYVLWPFRVALSGKKASAGPFEIAEILGKERTLDRICQAIDKFS